METAPPSRMITEKIAVIKAQIKAINDYKAKLEAEKAEWEAVVTKHRERQSAMEARSKEKNMQKIEAKVSHLLDDIGHRPEHILMKTFNEFQVSMGNSADKLRREIAALKADCFREKQSIEIVETRQQNLVDIINERCEEDFAKKVDLWTKARAFSQKNLVETAKFIEAAEMMEKEIGALH